MSFPFGGTATLSAARRLVDVWFDERPDEIAAHLSAIDDGPEPSDLDWADDMAREAYAYYGPRALAALYIGVGELYDAIMSKFGW